MPTVSDTKNLNSMHKTGLQNFKGLCLRRINITPLNYSWKNCKFFDSFGLC